MNTKIINIVSNLIKERCNPEKIDTEIKYILSTDSEFYHLSHGLDYWVEGTPHIKRECLVFSKENALRILKDANMQTYKQSSNQIKLDTE